MSVTVLHHLKRCVRLRDTQAAPRVVGVDDWAWSKGKSYEIIMVDLEWRCVVNVLPDRASSSTAAWFREHPEIEVVSRDLLFMVPICVRITSGMIVEENNAAIANMKLAERLDIPSQESGVVDVL